MIILRNNEVIEMNQGDYGNLGFTTPEYEMTTGDKAILVVSQNGVTKFKLEITEWKEGVGYFSFNKIHTVNMVHGIYNYQVAIKFKSGEVNVTNENKLILKRGVVNEL